MRQLTDQRAGAGPSNSDQAQGEAREGFIVAQNNVLVVVEKMQGAVSSDLANTKYEAEFQAVIKKHGFKDLAKYEVVATNNSMVMAATDSQARRRGGFEPPPSGRD